MKKLLTAAVIFAYPWWVPIPAWADTPEEDSPSWSCVDDGNKICGPDNSEGKPPGLYDEGGVLIAPWPVWTLA